jgi:hypothetical protein
MEEREQGKKGGYAPFWCLLDYNHSNGRSLEAPILYVTLKKCILCFAFLSFFVCFFLVANNNLEQESGMRENRIGRIGRRFWKIFFLLIPPPNR